MPRVPKVLVVEDEKLIRWALRQELANMGCEVLESGDGVEALNLVSAHRPDVVLLDITLPRLNGMEVLRRIHVEHPGCAVVVITAHGTPEMAREAALLGASEFVKKPFKNEEISRLVGMLLEQSQS